MTFMCRCRCVSASVCVCVYDLYVSLQEIDRCSPYFVAVLGERYGWIPDALDANTLTNYPWLQLPRNRNILLPGVRASALELGVLNGFLVDPDLARHHVFFFRDLAHAGRTGVPRAKRHNFVPASEYGREAVAKLRDQIRAVDRANVIRYHGMYATKTR
jgi:hypothetical protein